MDATVSVKTEPDNAVVTRDEWHDARLKLLELEKEETHLRDKVRAARQALPWVKVDKDYTFDTPSGKRNLADLFDGRSQLLVYHFMFGPGWKEGCVGCSFMADHFDGTLPHLSNHDVTLVAISRGTLAEIENYKKRMGWHFPWLSSNGSDFNFDYHVSFTEDDMKGDKITYNFREIPPSEGYEELPGLSAFYKNENGDVFHTYSTYARGSEETIGTLMLLDRAPLGRNEAQTMNFVKRHDEDEQKPDTTASSCCH
ncbi:DUF899 domain-containing protein [Endobacterium cereale]|uniref:DUF899 domain-containing protein n=1 Tax=Endobacterium cereale TaxID=2663029 RepID=UPI002B46B833|nr:thioredoxin family protein [Endobacterium cereale]MEB2844272.1 thioredoxin family protein [Endobacterium cereale]